MLLVCVLEIGLQVLDSYTGQLSPRGPDGQTLLVDSWLTHHGLKPSQSLETRNPDTMAAVRISTNSFGLRGSEVAVPKPSNVYRIVCLGDEAVLAAELDQSDTFCAQLQELLQTRTPMRVEVVNAGVPGYCPLLSYLQVRHSLLSLDPDLLILNFDMSDVSDDHRYRRHTLIGGESMPLACPHPALDTRDSNRLAWPGDRFVIPRWCKQQVDRFTRHENGTEDLLDIDVPHGRYAWLRDNPPDWSVSIRQALSPISHLNRMAQQVRSQLVVTAIPAPWQVSASASNGAGVREAVGVPQNVVYRSRIPFELLGTHVRRHGIPYCDACSAFRSVEQPQRLFLKNAPRLSAEGHTLVARELAGFLVENVRGAWSGRSPNRQPYQPPMRQAFSSNR